MGPKEYALRASHEKAAHARVWFSFVFQALLAKGLDPDHVATILVEEKLEEMGFYDQEPEPV